MAQELWFAPGDDLEVRGVISHPDFPELFRANSWEIGSKYVKVFQSRPAYLVRKSPDEIDNMSRFLKERQIALAIALSMLPSETCGHDIEGFLRPNQVAIYAKEMKRRNVNLSYVVIDEPLYYGRDYRGPEACSFDTARIAEDVAKSAKAIRAYYPGVKFVLAEPEQALTGGAGELAEFLDEYKARLGEFPVSVRIDIQWQNDWRAKIPAFIAMLQKRQIGFGIIYNATRAPKSDDAWIESAKQNVVSFESLIRAQPNQVVIQTWNPNPVRIVPETDPATMAGYLKWYIVHHYGAR